MCNHYRDQEELKFLRQTVPGLYIPAEMPVLDSHLYPKRPAKVVVREDTVCALAVLRWGVWPFYAKDKAQYITNARGDGLLSKAIWRNSAKTRRCLIPATGYFEPGLGPPGAKGEILFTVKDHPRFFIAGLWDTDPDGSGNRAFAMVTTEPNDYAVRFHDRMPVVLTNADAVAWLGNAPLPDAHLLALCRGLPADALHHDELPPKLKITKKGTKPKSDDGPELLLG
jgi:putative SOS response-associated peptidase YedK